MQIENDVKLDFDDVLIRPKWSEAPSRSQICLIRNYTFMHGREWGGVPIIAANMETVGTLAMAGEMRKHKMLTCLHKYHRFEDVKHWDSCFYTMGIRDEDFAKLKSFLDKVAKSELRLPFVCIDAANGYTEFFHRRVADLRTLLDSYDNTTTTIMAGNVCTPEMVQKLLLSRDADIVKVGIGPGSACTTRLVTGVGYPQLSAIMECADAAHGIGGHICADGGCRTPGDVAKAIAAGADFVMLGGMLAGTEECEGTWVNEDGEVSVGGHDKKRLRFYGSSSQEAMLKREGLIRDYRAAEGKSVEVPYKGSVDGILREVMGGLRSTCTYAGADMLKDLSKCSTFIRVNRTHNTVYE